MRCDEHDRLLGVLRQGQELLAQGMRRPKLTVHDRIPPQAPQHGKNLVRLVQSLTEVLRTVVGLFHLRRRVAFRGTQRYSQGDIYVYFALETLRGLGERFE